MNTKLLSTMGYYGLAIAALAYVAITVHDKINQAYAAGHAAGHAAGYAEGSACNTEAGFVIRGKDGWREYERGLNAAVNDTIRRWDARHSS